MVMRSGNALSADKARPAALKTVKTKVPPTAANQASNCQNFQHRLLDSSMQAEPTYPIKEKSEPTYPMKEANHMQASGKNQDSILRPQPHFDRASMDFIVCQPSQTILMQEQQARLALMQQNVLISAYLFGLACSSGRL
jgi:hypothetical protein